jgi:hypothetical protein
MGPVKRMPGALGTLKQGPGSRRSYNVQSNEPLGRKA